MPAVTNRKVVRLEGLTAYRPFVFPLHCLGPQLQGHTKGVYFATFSPNDRYLATCSHDWTIIVWSLDDGSVQSTLRGHSGWVS